VEVLEIDIGNDGSVIGWIVECNVGRQRNGVGSGGCDGNTIGFGECELGWVTYFFFEERTSHQKC